MAMERVYKLTDMGLYTHNDTQWGQGVTHKAPGGGAMCSNRWLHAYRTPELAAFMNPAHANIHDPVLWACLGEIGTDDGTKVGCTVLRTIGTVAMPEPSTLQRVAFSIMCAQSVCHVADWLLWAERWLAGVDRSAASSASAASAATDVADAAGTP